MFYWSKGLNNVQLFVEFLFEILHEKNEPIILVVELLKSMLKINEYYQLVHKEKVSSYLELESYKELTLLKEIKHNHVLLMRSNRRVHKNSGMSVREQIRIPGKAGLKQSLRELGIKEPTDSGLSASDSDSNSNQMGHKKRPKEAKIKVKNLDAINEEQEDEQGSSSGNETE